MKVKYTGHNDVLLTDFDGKRYAFHKNKIVDVPEKVYDNMKTSHSVEIFDLHVVEEQKEVAVVDKTVEKEAPKAKPMLKKFKKRSRKKK